MARVSSTYRMVKNSREISSQIVCKAPACTILRTDQKLMGIGSEIEKLHEFLLIDFR